MLLQHQMSLPLPKQFIHIYIHSILHILLSKSLVQLMMEFSSVMEEPLMDLIPTLILKVLLLNGLIHILIMS